MMQPNFSKTIKDFKDTQISFFYSPDFINLSERKLLKYNNSLETIFLSSPNIDEIDHLSCFIKQIKYIPVLSPEEETFLFRKYNYLKYQLNQTQLNVETFSSNNVLSKKINFLNKQINKVKNIIILYNLRLVVSFSTKYCKTHKNNVNILMDIISQGNSVLLYTIDKFNYTLNYKFSSYLYSSLCRKISNTCKENQKIKVFPINNEGIIDYIKEVEYNNCHYPTIEKIDEARKIIDKSLENLTEREKIVIQEYYQLTPSDKMMPNQRPSYNTIGKKFNLTKERIRQIHEEALEKLRKKLKYNQFSDILELENVV